jgi:dihydroorotate dehydrogenase (NAD+) catalytic subunit
MLNSVGLANPGIDHWLAEDLPALAATGARVVVSVWASRVEGYRAVAQRVADAVEAGGPADCLVALEANISCPNLEDRREMFAHSVAGAGAAVGAVAGALGGRLALWAKLSPNVTDLAAIAGAVLDAGAETLVLTNTLMGLALDPETGEARLGAGGGGLSGSPLHPVAVRAVYDCRVAYPAAGIVGVGGVARGVDAAEFLVAGADAVQVGTATFADPAAPARVLGELTRWCRRHEVRDVRQLVGRAQRTRATATASAATATAATQTAATHTAATHTAATGTRKTGTAQAGTRPTGATT